MSALLRVNGVDPDGAHGTEIVKSFEVRPVPKGTVEMLVGFASRFRLMGGSWTAAEIAGMHPVEREACLIAGEQFASGSALLVARAASGPLGAAEVARDLDGGASLAQLAAAQLDAAFNDLRLATRASLRRAAGAA